MLRLKPSFKAAVLALSLATPLCTSASSHPDAPGHPPPHSILVGYFPQWGIYNDPQFLVRNLAATRSAAMLDQLNYAQGFVTGGHCSIADPNADLNYTFKADQSVDGIADTSDTPFRGNLNQLVKLKQRFPKLKIVISLEGQASSFAADAQPETRHAFVESCIDVFIRGNFAPGIHVPGLFDGFDIDWEFPHAEDSANYSALLSEFRQQLNAERPGLLLNIAVGKNPRMSGLADESSVKAVIGLVDQVGIMTYDYTGPWSRKTGLVAPFSSSPDHAYGTVQGSVSAYLSSGVPASKLIMGVPFYGYGWHTVEAENNGLFQAGEPVRGDRPYSYIETLIPHSTVYRESGSGAPWLFDGDAFWTYEDPASIQLKTEYAVQQHLGGLMMWELGEDSASASLLTSAYQALHPDGPNKAKPSTEPRVKAVSRER